jgi:protein-disulfide isomerase
MELLFFTGEDNTCPACENVKPTLKTMCEKRKIKIKEIIATENIELAQRYNVCILPTIVYKEQQIDGFPSVTMLQSLLDY